MASPPSASSRSEAEEVLESIRLKGIKRVTAEYVRNARQSRVPKTQEGHIPRPMNAFILFTTISPEHETLQEYYPRRKELLRHLGDIWRSTDWKRRKPYQDVATELTNEHKRLYPNYMFKPRPRKKSNVPKSPTGKDPGAALQPISTDPKVGCKFSMPNTMEDGQKIQNNVHSWDPYGPPPQNLLEYARVPARCLVEAGSSRSTPGDVSTTRTLDTVREETLGNEFLYQFHETLQSPQQACYETSPADLTSPTSPSNDGSSDELRTPSTQSTLQINPQTRPFNEFRISQTLGKVHCAANSTPSRVLKPSDLQAATSPPDNDLVEYLDDYKTHNSGNAYQVPPDDVVSAHPHTSYSDGRTDEQACWNKINKDLKYGSRQHDSFYAPLYRELSSSDDTDYFVPNGHRHYRPSPNNIDRDPLCFEDRILIPPSSHSFSTHLNDPSSFRSPLSAPYTERPYPPSPLSGTPDQQQFLAQGSDQAQFDQYPFVDPSLGYSVHSDPYQSSQYRSDLFNYPLSYLPAGETSISSHYAPSSHAAFSDASNLQ